MESLWHDLRYGIRMLAKSPGFTAVAVLALALGIGANSAIFSAVNGILLQPLPYTDPDKLVFLTEWSEQVPNMSFSVANYNDLRDQNEVFENLFAFRSANLVMTGEGEPERLNNRQVTASFFATFGVQPVLGRAFGAEEDKPGAERVVMLGEGFWTRRFGRDPGVIGKQLNLNGEPYTVIGVLTGNLHGTWATFDTWTSLGRLEDQLGGAQNRGNHPGIYVIARRKAGVSEEQARAGVETLAKRLAETYPNTNSRQSMTVQSMHEAVVGNLRQPLIVLQGAVAFVLLIACANVANLLLARAAARQKEIAVRTAMGAGRFRLIRQLLTENMLLSLAGGTLGLLVAYAAIQALVALAPSNTPRLENVALDAPTLIFTFVVAILTGFIFGIVPAFQVSRTTLGETLKEGGRAGAGAAGHNRVRSTLAVVEISLALVLLVGAGLMLKSFFKLMDADAGFDRQGTLTLFVSLPQVKYDQPPKVRQFIEQALERVYAVPGVRYASSATPLLGGWQTSFYVEGTPQPEPGQQPSTDWTRVSPDYFKAMGVRLIKGREFTAADHADSLPVCIVDETMVRTWWPNEEPIGKKLKLGGFNSTNPYLEVVGVVAHVKNYGVDQASRVETYLPYTQNASGFFSLIVRTDVAPGSLTTGIRQAVLAVDPDVPVYNIRTLEDIVDASVASRRLSMWLLGVFAALALVLSAVGIYGVMSYSVAQRTHEIGVRMALGAQPGDVMRLVIGQAVRLTVIGLVLGLGAAYGLSRWMASLLFEMSATDPLTYAVIPFILAVVAVLATYIPARRAMRVDPVIALRYE
ncbi:MAG TPA: ABC transporter permease [Candidatus Acidoferrales bacterium]